MKKICLFSITALVVLFITACASQQSRPAKAELPAGKAYAEVNEIYFVHTEASDAGVAEKLTNMMQSPVVFVPSLASVPDESLANVYVFTNGIEGKGPFGFQSDVFDNPPGTAGYTPLRRLNVITWADGVSAALVNSHRFLKYWKQKQMTSLPSNNRALSLICPLWSGMAASVK